MSRSLSQPVISLAFIFCLCASAAVALAQQGQQRQESNLVEMAMVARNVAQLTETNASEVELALDAVGTGSAEEMTGRIFANRFTVLDAEFRRRAVATLPDRIRSSRITEGQLLRRVEAVIKPVLEFHGRSDKVELFLYQGKQPLGMLWKESVLVLSDSLARPLRDEELMGVVAHELAHTYLTDEMLAADRIDDERAMRLVELKCDAIALLTLKLLGYDPALYVQGLQKIETISSYIGLLIRVHGRSHPTMSERMQLAERLLKLLA